MWVTKLLISPVKKKDFLPKNDPIWPEIGIFVHFGPGLTGSFGWWLWRAGCISQDTYLLYFSNRETGESNISGQRIEFNSPKIVTHNFKRGLIQEKGDFFMCYE